MAYACSGDTNAELIANLQDNGILTCKAAAAAMVKLDRADFCLNRAHGYDDSPQVIGYNATISAPHMHAYCLSLLADHLKPGMSVLDVGSGSGYLTAAFALMVGETGTAVGVEHIPQLVERSVDTVSRSAAGDLLRSGRLSFHVADGKVGFRELAPFDAIHVGAAAAELPKMVVEQLKPGGRMVVPVGKYMQDLMVLDKKLDGSIEEKAVMDVAYVPLV